MEAQEKGKGVKRVCVWGNLKAISGGMGKDFRKRNEKGAETAVWRVSSCIFVVVRIVKSHLSCRLVYKSTANILGNSPQPPISPKVLTPCGEAPAYQVHECSTQEHSSILTSEVVLWTIPPYISVGSLQQS